MEQYMPIVWIGFAIFMLLCEGFTTQLVSIWFVLGSVCAAITTIFTSDITIQSAVFLVVSLVSLIVTRPLVKRLAFITHSGSHLLFLLYFSLSYPRHVQAVIFTQSVLTWTRQSFLV